MPAPRTLIRLGAAGTALGLLCCFTPVLPVVLGAMGATGLLGVLYNDVILLGFAGVSFGVLIIGLIRRRAAT